MKLIFKSGMDSANWNSNEKRNPQKVMNKKKKKKLEIQSRKHDFKA